MATAWRHVPAVVTVAMVLLCALSGSPVAADSIEPLRHELLQELVENEPLAGSIARALEQCRHTDASAGPQTIELCSRLEYAHDVRNSFPPQSRDLRIVTDSSPAKDVPEAVMGEAGFNYQAFVLERAASTPGSSEQADGFSAASSTSTGTNGNEASIAAHSNLLLRGGASTGAAAPSHGESNTADADAQRKEWLEYLEACRREGKPNAVTNDISLLENCAFTLPSLTLPSLASNNLLARDGFASRLFQEATATGSVNATAETNEHDGGDGQNSAGNGRPRPVVKHPERTVPKKQRGFAEFDVETLLASMFDPRTQWPALVPLGRAGETTPGRVHSTPDSMHTLLWSVKGPVEVRIFDPAGKHAAAKRGAAARYHYPIYELQGFDRLGFGETAPSVQAGNGDTGGARADTSDEEAEFRTAASVSVHFQRAVLQEGDLLYIGPGQPYAIRALNDQEDNSVDPPLLLKLAYVDALNFNAFKAHLALIGRVAKRVHSAQVSAELLQALTLASFPTKMEREPVPLAYSDYVSWPRAVTRTAVDDTTTAAGGGAPGRRKKGNFRAWQEQNRWDRKMTTLTLPEVSQPEILEVGRTWATVRWISQYAQPEDDSTTAGFNASWIVDHAEVADAPKRGWHAMTLPDLQVELSLEHTLLSGIESYSYQGTVHGLTHSAAYRTRLQVFYGSSGGPMSPPSVPFVTTGLNPPNAGAGVPEVLDIEPTAVRIGFHVPSDDGGSPILGYHIFANHVDEHTHDDWVLMGSYEGVPEHAKVKSERLASVVSHLLPNTRYQFRVVAFNQFGDGESSVASDTIRTPTLDAGHEATLAVSGLGHRDKLVGTLHSAFTHEPLGPVVTLSDRQQTLSSDQAGSVEVWTCHYSPRTHDVVAEAVLVQPEHADKPVLDNADDVKQRIAVVRRGGGVPIVQKVVRAQRAGALAVLVVDNGQCSSFDQHCMPGSDKLHGGLFAALDVPTLWQHVRIPVALVMHRDAHEVLGIANLMDEPASAARDEL